MEDGPRDLLLEQTSDLDQLGPSSDEIRESTVPATKSLTLECIRKAIPDHCFVPSTSISAAHIILNVSLTLLLGACTLRVLPLISSTTTRWALWLAYGYLQGLLMTGIWILAHECGHQALFASTTTNDVVGFILHSALLVPYFSWKYTHARHHRYTNNMDKDTAFVPTRATEKRLPARIAEFCMQNQDAPAFAAALLALHQLLGWPSYLFWYITGGENSLPSGAKVSENAARSHFNPGGDMWLANQKPFVLLSDAGLIGTLGCLYISSQIVGAAHVFALYAVPCLWVNNWLVAITYLHHTHPEVLHFENSKWTYLDGALSTVDRPYGFVGKHIFHGIIDFHVVHHLFPRIPFYHAEEATNAMVPVLGHRYRQDRSSFWGAMWNTFRTCHYVAGVPDQPGIVAWKNSHN